MEVAVIGLGNIGSGVAKNLLKYCHQVHVVDVDAQKVATAVSHGAMAATSSAEAVGDAEIVFTSLPGPADIERVADEILPAMASGTIWADLSTNDLDTFQTLRERAAKRGVVMIDAPVSGGPEGAAAGTLSVFVGADAKDFKRVKPRLFDIGDSVTHLGPPGAALIAKIAQDTLCYTQTITLIEAMLLGAKGGVDPKAMLDVIIGSAGTSYSAETYGPEILAGTYDPSFPISHAAKDLRLAMDLASQVGADLPLTKAVAELYAQTEAELGPNAAHCLAAHLVEKRNDLILNEETKA